MRIYSQKTQNFSKSVTFKVMLKHNNLETTLITLSYVVIYRAHTNTSAVRKYVDTFQKIV